jgi:hypothetical protein
MRRKWRVHDERDAAGLEQENIESRNIFEENSE